MRNQAGVVVLLLAVVVGACSDPGGDDWSAAEHVADDSVDPIEGEYAGGTWGVYVDTTGQLCGATQSADVVSGVCGSMDDLAVTLHDADGRPTVLFGVVPEGTVGIATPDGRESWTSWSATEASDGSSIYAIVLQNERIPTEIAFYNGEAEPIETAGVDP